MRRAVEHMGLTCFRSNTAGSTALIRRVASSVFLYSALLLCGFAQDHTDAFADIDEGGLRAMISTLKLPEYPPQDIQNRVTGVAVVKVCLDGHRRPTKVDILQAPSQSTGDAVRAAIERSTFAAP